MILIWSNSREWGGVDVLIARFTDYLRDQSIDFVVAEPRNSQLGKSLREFECIDPAHVNALDVPVEAVFLPSLAKIRDRHIPWQKFGDARFFTYVVHPNDPISTLVPAGGAALRRFGYRSVKALQRMLPTATDAANKLITYLASGRSLAVMDGATRRSLDYIFPLQTDLLMIPIPSPLSKAKLVDRIRNERLTIGYLGRLDAMKISALGPFVQHSLRPLTQIGRRVRLLCVGGGANLGTLRRVCAHSAVELEHIPALENAVARRLLAEQATLCVAMGTAALDLAGSGSPCLIIDPAVTFRARPQRRFRFVHEIEQQTLGEFRDFPAYNAGLRSFDECLHMVRNPALGELGRAYVASNHDPARLFNQLVRAIGNARTTCGEFESRLASMAREYNSVYESVAFWTRTDIRHRFAEMSPATDT